MRGNRYNTTAPIAAPMLIEITVIRNQRNIQLKADGPCFGRGIGWLKNGIRFGG